MAGVKLGRNKREKTLLSVLFVMIIAAVYFNLLFKPSIDELMNLLPKVSVLKADLADAKELISTRKTIEQNEAQARLKMDEYKEIFPSEEEVPKLLESLSSIAGKSRVKIIGIRPFGREGLRAAEKNVVYQEIPIEIVAQCGYHELGQFLQRLETGDRFIMVKDMDINANPENIKRHNIKLILSTYILIAKGSDV
ncbi:MAG: type 4a pilus biogenesis protein PilO [Candidatus Omnitrophica bacterium]|nr:type 4a pilus biogenesis protein PilO [Candidatus Omnitrophota bacterium]